MPSATSSPITRARSTRARRSRSMSDRDETSMVKPDFSPETDSASDRMASFLVQVLRRSLPTVRSYTDQYSALQHEQEIHCCNAGLLFGHAMTTPNMPAIRAG